MEISSLEGKIKVKRIRNDLDKFEMNKLGAKINAEIEILGKKAKQKQSMKNNKRHTEIKIKVKRDGNNENTKYISKYVSKRNKTNPYQIWKKI